jgi:hypothetical protein
MTLNTTTLKMLTNVGNTPLLINEDQITMASSQYQLNTNGSSASYTFNGGTQSKVQIKVGMLEFYNTNKLSSTQYFASTSLFPVVLNGNVLINGDLNLTGKIKSNVNPSFSAAAAQASGDTLQQFTTYGLKGIPNI